MTIYFSPSYTSGTYMDLNARSGGIAMDASICDTAGLVNLIELHSGIYHPELSDYELLVAYLKALREMDSENHSNVLHNSLENDAISTAKTCLAWRDELVLAGWKPSMGFSPRLDVIAETEKHFHGCTLADRLLQLPNLIRTTSIAPTIHLVLPYSQDILHPALGAVVEALIEKGATVEIMPDTQINAGSNLRKIADWFDYKCGIDTITASDDSMSIIEFENRAKAIDWLSSLNPSEHEVWISDHCADIDRALAANEKAMCGSTADPGLPAISQIAMLAVSQFLHPVNLNMLVAWLRMPRSPLPSVRFKIASLLLKEGGYDESKLEACLDDYKKNHPDADLDTIKKALNKYLHISNSNKADKKEFKKFIENILAWVEEECQSEHLAENQVQLNDLKSRLKALLMLVEMEACEALDNGTLEKWMVLCGDACSYTQYAAQKGAHLVISNPGNIIGDADHVVWCSFSNFEPMSLACEFLSVKELEELKKAGCTLYDPETEIQARRIARHWPLHHCKCLTIIEMAEKDPDEVRSMMSQQLRSMPKGIWDKLIGSTQRQTPGTPVLKLDANFFTDMPTEINISNGASVSFREKESYSSLDLLIQRPLDYMMKYVLGIKPVSDDEAELNTSMGNVAHYVIENIFTPERPIKDIKSKWRTEYNGIFNEALMRNGLIILLPENKIEKVRLDTGLQKAIETLIGIIEANRMTVIDCEKTFIADNLLGPNTSLEAKLDMRLKREDGSQAIIDLKWSGNPLSYREKIMNEQAMQLDIYASVLSKVPEGSPDIISGFFVMPRCKLYTCDNFKGKSVEIVQTSHSTAVAMTKICNSYNYRIKQLSKGIIEMGYGLKAKDIQYDKDTATQQLYPLLLNSGKKVDNKYSDYKEFNS